MAAGIQKTDSGWKLDAAVIGVAIDSRRVKPGYVFVAIPGATSDGHSFIADAISRGAVAIVGERPGLKLGVPYFQVPSSRIAAAELSAAFYRYPSRQLIATGVTGTNGKTSVVYWLTALLRAGGYGCGMISSVINDSGRGTRESVLTTPESPDLQQQLREMADSGLTHAVIEISSHGIAQHRVDQIDLDLAVLTNITREHLDFHGTMENYVATKSLLFERMPADSRGVVINADDHYSQRVLNRVVCPALTYGMQAGELRAQVLSSSAWSSRVRLAHRDFDMVVQLNHPGLYNVYNLTAAVAAAYRLGVTADVIERVVPTLPEVPGRMQVFQVPGKPMVIIDYAHTPDGLTQSLQTVRQMVSGKIWLVFGARGGRDRGKRPEMGEIAARLADRVVLTSDSPNDEDPLAIARAIEVGIRHIAKDVMMAIELDRSQAIQWAVDHAQADDCVLVTGRGPESYQYFRQRRVRIKDGEVAEQALGIGKGRDGIGIH
ncbi:MAG: UDP-N-acetylmuramoyl-L-alanyl-D-glutamate--2,6-diaminopimelate ligase [Sulfobacillus acidophilus]|uniref:UDP-N-acetylmuramyl-tripeptide synthetase n=1 Tax=Sulfobacillus acidophilus TaxID=53633 RepID=A0A2T2WCS7_9FIRM|nr:MAG: UDP-N-acetylmuramoyl-L-alanyl-D-glutamate--2,6-diaminopimelate ligase [Sulfobacillus acidophilus]